MNIINFNQENFLKLLKWIFIPVAVIIVVVGIISIIYKKVSKNKKNSSRIIDLFTSLLSIVITSLLLVIVINFSLSFIETMKSKGLVEGNEIIYYLILFIPIIPFLFLIYCIVKFAKAIALGHQEEIINDEIKNQEQEENQVVSNEEKMDGFTIATTPMEEPKNENNSIDKIVENVEINKNEEEIECL